MIRSLGIDIIRYPARDSFRWELMRLWRGSSTDSR
jgi:hypothetical protein